MSFCVPFWLAKAPPREVAPTDVMAELDNWFVRNPDDIYFAPENVTKAKALWNDTPKEAQLIMVDLARLMLARETPPNPKETAERYVAYKMLMKTLSRPWVGIQSTRSE